MDALIACSQNGNNSISLKFLFIGVFVNLFSEKLDLSLNKKCSFGTGYDVEGIFLDRSKTIHSVDSN